MTRPEAQAEALRWLRYAQDDLSGAEAALVTPGLRPRHACWLSQQAAENAIKAARVLLQVEFPRTHDLNALLNRLPDGWEVKVQSASMAPLSEWAVEARYPSELPEATPGDARDAVKQAAAAVQSVRLDMARLGAGED